MGRSESQRGCAVVRSIRTVSAFRLGKVTVSIRARKTVSYKAKVKLSSLTVTGAQDSIDGGAGNDVLIGDARVEREPALEIEIRR